MTLCVPLDRGRDRLSHDSSCARVPAHIFGLGTSCSYSQRLQHISKSFQRTVEHKRNLFTFVRRLARATLSSMAHGQQSTVHVTVPVNYCLQCACPRSDPRSSARKSAPSLSYVPFLFHVRKWQNLCQRSKDHKPQHVQMYNSQAQIWVTMSGLTVCRRETAINRSRR